jgi:hypothetical protein
MKTIRAISSVLLAFLMLVSSTSFIVGVHVCMGEVQNVALFAKAEGCAMEQQLPPCHKHTQAPCCDDETFIHKGTDVKTSFENISFVTPWAFIVEAPLIVLSEIVPPGDRPIIDIDFYDPPLPSIDRTVILQIFLI